MGYLVKRTIIAGALRDGLRANCGGTNTTVSLNENIYAAAYISIRRRVVVADHSAAHCDSASAAAGFQEQFAGCRIKGRNHL